MRNMKGIFVSFFLIISLMGCVAALDTQNGVEMRPGEAVAEKLFNHGVGEAWRGGNPPFGSFDWEFSQFYSMNKEFAPNRHIEAPMKHEMKDELPTTVYFGYQMQAMPYTQYETLPVYTGGNSLWIQGATSWTQYAQVPEGSTLSLLATSSAGGNGILYEIGPDGVLSQNSFQFFSGSSLIPFYADTVGQHILLFVIGGQVSNAIVINVAQYAPPDIQPYSPPQYIPYPHEIYLHPNQPSSQSI